MSQFSESDLAKARARWDVIAGDVALKRKGREFSGCCPFHNEKTPSFYVTPDKGFFHCFGCGAHGTAIDYLMRARGLQFLDAVRELLDLPPQRAREAPAERRSTAPIDHQDTIKDVRRILSECVPITDRTAAWLYLWSRLSVVSPNPVREAGLLAHPELYCHEVKAPLPALVAPVTSSADEITAIQRIWLEPSGYIAGQARDNRAPLKARKKSLGRLGDGAVRLARAGRILGLAEGPETAIAVKKLYRVPCWASCGAGRLGSIWIPPNVEKLIVFGDNGETGRALAERAHAAFVDRGIDCDLEFPDGRFGDFADQLVAGVAA